MFERFTHGARQVVVAAQEEAVRLGQPSLGTEHLLLGLIADSEGIAGEVLRSCGLELAEVRGWVARYWSGAEPVVLKVEIGPRAKKALEMSLREALMLSDHFIGSEHVLLGLLQVHEGAVDDLLGAFDIDPDDVRGGVLSAVASRPVAARRGFEDRPVRHAPGSVWTAPTMLERTLKSAIRAWTEDHGRPPCVMATLEDGECLTVVALVPSDSRDHLAVQVAEDGRTVIVRADQVIRIDLADADPRFTDDPAL